MSISAGVNYGNKSIESFFFELKKTMDMEIEILDASDGDFQWKLDFAIWSTGSSSDYRNDRERPYNGQSWTVEGESGKREVEGLTMRDIQDCFVKALLISCASEKYLEPETFLKCWDFSTNPPMPTQFLLDNQNDPDFVHTKVEIGTWRTQDVYKIDLSKIDPLVVAKNLICEIEKMMGIFPNHK